MRTVDYSDVLRGSAALAGLQPTDLNTAEFALFRSAHDRRLQFAWEIHRWPEICRYEQRNFRAPWDASHAYAAGDEVLDVPTLTYLQALQASTGQAPTTNNVVNLAYWAPCQTQYQANAYVAGSTYAIGDQVLYTDQQVYQLYALPMVAANAGDPSMNNSYWPAGTLNGKAYYVATGGNQIAWDGTNWNLRYQDQFGWHTQYTSTDAVATPNLVTTWTAVGGTLPVPTVTLGSGSFPAGWAKLTPFNRYIGYEQTLADGTPLTPIGEFLFAWDRDPRVTTKLCPLRYTLSSDGAQFTTLRHASAQVWLLYRLRRPELTGDLYDPTVVYTPGRQVYYINATTGAGNFYDCSTTTTAGDSPASAPAKWSVVALPYTFRQYLIQGGYADWLTADGQTDKAGVMENVAGALLEAEADKLQRQQGQTNRLQFSS